MIIKTLPISQKNIYRAKQLTRYILQLDELPNEDPFQTFLLLQNLSTTELEKLHKDILKNDRLYRKQRANGVAFYHEVLSFSDKDSEHITDKTLEILTKKYIELRCPEAILVAKAHHNCDHKHVHLLVSGTNYKSDTCLRLSRKEFKEVRIELERFQKEHFPELKHSIAYLDKIREKSDKKRSDQNRRAENEFQMKARLQGKQPTKKEVLHQRISEVLKQAKSPKEFLLTLKAESDLELYEYRGKITGIIFENRKFRFSTLGIDKHELQKLREQHLRMKQLNKQQNNIDKTRGRY